MHTYHAQTRTYIHTHTRPLTHTRTLGSLTQSRVVVCDEVDSFPTETVLTLLEPMSRHQHVLIIGASPPVPPAVADCSTTGIANSLDMGATVRANPRMHDVKLIQYNPYTPEEMASIARYDRAVLTRD